MIDPTAIFVSEYSHKQGCFHVETLAEALKKNTCGIVTGAGQDFLPFAISSDWRTASDICEKLKAFLESKGSDGK